MMDDLVKRARVLAELAHAGQVDKAGRPYIEHVARVAAAVADDPEAEAVAWLHDVLEDTRTDPRVLDAMFAPPIVEAVEVLTATLYTNRAYYYAAILRNRLALRVKLADIADNADEARLSLLDEATAARLRRKYAKARAALKGAQFAKLGAEE